ncbi:MAG TPA: ribosome silencing factor [Candidatus Eisenbacteria bacterium]|nr:ribosome silencing factor [Candidatus Eisenbacteria bacterium]
MTDAARRKPDGELETEPAGEPTDEATADSPSEPASEAAAAATRQAKPRRADGLPVRAGSAPAGEERSSLDIARRIVELAEDKKAADIVLLDLSPLTTVADYFVICSGGSERQLEAIAAGVISGMRDERIRPFGREGTAASHWILVDFSSVIVHVFTPPERDFYQLERHWAEAKTILRLQ